MVKTPEHDKQRRFTYLGIASLCAAPFIGPAGLIAGGAIFAGKAARHIFNNQARRDYANEKAAMKIEHRNHNQPTPNLPQIYTSPMQICNPMQSYNQVQIYEPTETTLARSIPQRTLRLLAKENQRIQYTKSLEVGARMVNRYLEGMSEEEISKIKEIEIVPETKNHFLGIPIGRKHLEVIVKR